MSRKQALNDRKRIIRKNFLPWGRIIFVVAAMLSQIFLIAWGVKSASQLSPFISTALLLLSILVSIKIWNSEVNASYKFPWILLIIMFPLGGGLYYLISGVPKTNRWGLRKYSKNSRKIKSRLFKDMDCDMPDDIPPEIKRQSTLLNHSSGYPCYTNTKIDYFSSGEAQFKKMIEDLKAAKESIFLEYFIISKGELWDELFAILAERAKAGVDIRVIYDDIGSIWNLPPRFIKKLDESGIQAKVFNPLSTLPSFIFNNRDHRKIVVIDGKIAYTGGTNLADEYVNAIERFGYWKDAAIRLEGPAVRSFTIMFLSLWNHMNRQLKKDINDFEAYLPETEKPACPLDFDGDEAPVKKFDCDSGYVMPFDDIPDDLHAIGLDTYRAMIQRANHSVRIMTPYLVLDDGMIEALTTAAASGVNVEIITPHIPDKPYVLEVTRSYYSKLIEQGVKIYEFTPGFIHSKVVLVDDQLVVVGTINFDYRSFYLHMECAVWMYRVNCIADIKRDFDQTIAVCQIISSEDLKRRGFWKRSWQTFLRMFAPLM